AGATQTIGAEHIYDRVIMAVAMHLQWSGREADIALSLTADSLQRLVSVIDDRLATAGDAERATLEALRRRLQEARD
ncbi:MAG: hypothetical protein KAX65_13780, partial [Caldilineaceae bacterium]|nr:hypothetical protein [Caldilineaceae bacterium]